MKMILINYGDHVEVSVKDSDGLGHSYTFDNLYEANAFCSGFRCAQSVINRMVQSLPMSFEVGKPATKG